MAGEKKAKDKMAEANMRLVVVLQNVIVVADLIFLILFKKEILDFSVR